MQKGHVLGSDIAQGKITPLILLTLERLDNVGREKFLDAFYAEKTVCFADLLLSD